MVDQGPLSFSHWADCRVASRASYRRAVAIECLSRATDGRDSLTLGLEMAGYQVDAIRPIALASRDEPEERERSRAAGFDTHLVRPVSPNRVHQTLRQLLGHRI